MVKLFKAFIWREVIRQPIRSAATLLGIAAGIAVIVAIQMANASSVRSFTAAVETMAGKTSLEIVGPAGSLDETMASSLGWLRDFGQISPVVEADMQVETPGGGQESIRVLGVDILLDNQLRDYELLDFGPTVPAQAFLNLLLDERAVILTEKFAARHGLHIGSQIVVLAGDRRDRLTVTGLLRNRGTARTLDGNFGLMDIAAAQAVFNRVGRLDRVDLRLPDPSPGDAPDDRMIREAEREIATRLPEGLTVQRPARRGQQVEKMLQAFHFNLTALSYVALLVGLFLIYNNVSTSVVGRRAEIGMLRAIGATRTQVVGLFLGEAGLFALLGCSAGLLLARVLAFGAVSITSTTVNSLYVTSEASPPPISLHNIALAFLVGVPLSLLAAGFPALEASRVPPTAALRGVWMTPAHARRRIWRQVLPAAVLGLAAWLFSRLPAWDSLPLGGYASALSLVFGAAFIIPAVLQVGLSIASGRLDHYFGIEGRLASANLLASLRRISVPVAALAVSLAMMVAIAVMVGSFRETVVYWVTQTLQADLYVRPASRTNISTDSPISAEAEELLRRHPAIEAISRYRNFDVPYRDSKIVVAGGDFASQIEHGALLFKAPADGKTAMRFAIGRDSVLVSEPFAIRYGAKPGDRIRLQTSGGQKEFQVAAVFYDYSSDRGVVVMDYGVLARHFFPAENAREALRPTSLSIYLKPGQAPDRVREQLLTRLGTRFQYFIYTNSSLRNEVFRVFDRTFAITYALELVAIVVALVGIITTLLTLILERKGEITTLRQLGAERRQIRKMIMLESGIMGTLSLALGILVGLLLSLVLIYVINVQSFGWTIQFRIPWMFLLQTSVLVIITTILAGLYPASVAGRMSKVEQTE